MMKIAKSLAKGKAQRQSKKIGIAVRSNVKAGDFWDELRAMSAATYGVLTTGAIISGAAGTESGK